MLPEGHRFPGQKYQLVREQLEYEGYIKKENLSSPELITDREVELVHSHAYWQRVKRLELSEMEIRRIGFPRNEAIYLRSLCSTSGTVRAAEHAIRYGLGMNLAGGTHHAFADRGEGYCVLNDIAVAASVMLNAGKVKKVMVVDLDVHQGNGTAAIFRDEERVFTFSMHCSENYFSQKEYSSLDLEIPAGTGDVTYLDLLEKTLPALMEREKPDIIFYLAGVDVLAGDRLGKLALTSEGCAMRDKMVISLARSAGIALVIVMGGGYHNSLSTLVRAHAATFKTAIGLYEQKIYFSAG